MKSAKTNPRKSVCNLLLRMEKGAYSPIILDGELKSRDYDDRDKAFVTALFYGVTERRLTLDYIINKFTASKPPEQETRTLLRMALYQILFMDSVPESAAVNESVELAQKRAKGYVNAVLRNFLRNGKDLINEELTANLSLKFSCPEWLIEKWQSEYGEEALLQILETSLKKPPTFERDGYIQDLSCREACEHLNPQSGETIIDLCAAPGGKSFTIAQLMNNTGRIISCDINRKKLAIVANGAKKLCLSIIETHVNDAKVFNPEFPAADRVLCDVPCSGLGVIRRKPEIKYKNPADFDGLPAVQLQILKTGAMYVKESGTLMYSTCTLSRAENDDVVERFITRYKQFDLIDKKTVIPSENGGDGFFTALFKKTQKI
ncbi:MAG: 16S rRNA (cytosine(967)-C(5))-methyltransferase RsmB [Oscillospiraceae bacterium]|nr:16S rRNA (cytosine(967)-C(5))-methyltransferase RsmB [Oscillospiraceae bacterium]